MSKAQVISKLSQTDFSQHYAHILLTNEEIVFATKFDASLNDDFANLLSIKSNEQDGFYVNTTKLNEINAFALRHSLRGKKILIDPGTAAVLGEFAAKTPLPEAKISDDGKHVLITVPRIKFYKDLMTRLGAYPTSTFYKLRLDKLSDLEAHLEKWEHKFPKIELSSSVKRINSAPIVGFDGTLNSLKEIPISSLNVVKANIQNWSSLQKSRENLETKLSKHGIPTLHDLLFRLPRRYIDKSKPQLIDDLIIGENATIFGKVVSFQTLNSKVPGLRVTVKDSTGEKIAATFWRQNWIKAKFKPGDVVILNGTVTEWGGKLQLGGDSIEHFDEGVNLPVVPIYKQSINAGITSTFLIAAVRELLQRMGEVSLPQYFNTEGRDSMRTILSQIHFPANLDRYKEAVLSMAYYELVYMQLIMQYEKDLITGKPGVALPKSELDLQLKAAKALPYKLTASQINAVKKLNKLVSEELPSSSLLLADVGSGKTVTAQLLALRAVENGRQAVFIAPTDVLARQIYTSTQSILKMLQESSGENVSVVFLTGGMKAVEKREVLAKIKSGEADIIVSTQAAFGKTVEYKDLGLVIIDEQQKFGAEQRSQLLSSRTDGRVPHLLMQTATPIPRTTAQVYYGDIDIITMDEKPPGRSPIVTEWIKEDPREMTENSLHPVWVDVAAEAKKGNQTFVIAPMVVDSSRVDAASVERAYKALSERTLKNLKVAFVHGSMKADAQRDVMEKFRAREYDVLVASTVIEVGVDIPDATRVVILSADRLGASSLHQIRGRVGRSNKTSRCYLVSLGSTENSEIRLQALVDSENGFEIAQADLSVRGEGTMFATAQSGRSDMIFATLSLHSNLIEKAKEEARSILKSPFRDVAMRDARKQFEAKERLL